MQAAARNLVDCSEPGEVWKFEWAVVVTADSSDVHIMETQKNFNIGSDPFSVYTGT